MGITGIWQWVLILAIVLILFARPGKIAGIMGDFGKGLRNFRTGMKDQGADDGGDAEMIGAEDDPPVTAKKAGKKSAGKSRRA